jgi:recombinational DNA repair protein (RecF pathway)
MFPFVTNLFIYQKKKNALQVIKQASAVKQALFYVTDQYVFITCL